MFFKAVGKDIKDKPFKVLLPKEMFKQETMRLFIRHYHNKSNQRKELPEQVKTFVDTLIYVLSDIGMPDKNKDFDVMENLKGFLRIAAFIAREACE